MPLKAKFQDIFSIMEEINQYFGEEPFRKSRDEFQTELHMNPSCSYKKLFDCQIIGTSVKLTILIRVCFCRNQTNREDYLNKTVIYFSEIGDGVEAHFNEECEFIESDLPNGIRKFRKVCYCQRPQCSTLR